MTRCGAGRGRPPSACARVACPGSGRSVRRHDAAAACSGQGTHKHGGRVGSNHRCARRTPRAERAEVGLPRLPNAARTPHGPRASPSRHLSVLTLGAAQRASASAPSVTPTRTPGRTRTVANRHVEWASRRRSPRPRRWRLRPSWRSRRPCPPGHPVRRPSALPPTRRGRGGRFRGRPATTFVRAQHMLAVLGAERSLLPRRACRPRRRMPAERRRAAARNSLTAHLATSTHTPHPLTSHPSQLHLRQPGGRHVRPGPDVQSVRLHAV